MKRLFIAILLFAGFALAQQPAPRPVTLDELKQLQRLESELTQHQNVIERERIEQQRVMDRAGVLVKKMMRDRELSESEWRFDPGAKAFVKLPPRPAAKPTANGNATAAGPDSIANTGNGNTFKQEAPETKKGN